VEVIAWIKDCYFTIHRKDFFYFFHWGAFF
jgi:hypothetical protein